MVFKHDFAISLSSQPFISRGNYNYRLNQQYCNVPGNVLLGGKRSILIKVFSAIFSPFQFFTFYQLSPPKNCTYVYFILL